MADNPDDFPFNGLPYDDHPTYGISAHEALRNLLNHEEMLTDETFDFVHSCANFPRLSPRQEAALIDTWRSVEVSIMAKRARLQRKKRRRSNNGGVSSR
jgi:hypothetical protein